MTAFFPPADPETRSTPSRDVTGSSTETAYRPHPRAPVGRLMSDRPVVAVAIRRMSEGSVTVCDLEPALVEAR